MFFNILNITNFSNSLIKLAFFSNFLIRLFHYLSFSCPGARKSPIRFDNRLLNKCHRPLNCYQLLNITNFSNFLYKTCNFFQGFKFFFRFLQPQRPRNLLYRLLISYCIAFSDIELVFNFLVSGILAVFFKKLAIFKILKIFHQRDFLAQLDQELPLGFDNN